MHLSDHSLRQIDDAGGLRRPLPARADRRAGSLLASLPQ